MSRSIIYWLSFLLLLSSSSLIDANRLSTRMDFCWEKIRVTKFFRFHDQIFFTTNSVQYYDNFRLFNLTNGHLSQEFEIPDLGSNSNNDDQQQQQLRIIWAFTFDPLNDDNDDYCHNQNNIGPSSSSSTTSTNPYQSYCNRLRKLSDTIIARLSDMNLIYLSYRSGHLIEINNDDEPFLEFESFVKHLDQFGSISSITFDNQNNYYYSIHFVRLNQICMTRINNNNDNNNNEQIMKKNMAIPMLKNLFRKNPYQTDCLQTNRPYSSLINFNNIIYAIVLWFDSPVGYIDHLQLLNKHSNHSNLFEFKQIEQESDKKFFNCYHNSSIIPMMMMNGQKSSINTDVINNDIDNDDVNVEHVENKPSIQLIRNHRSSSSSASASASSKTNHSKISDRMINNQNNNNNQLNSTEQINNIIFWLIITMLILFAVNFCMIKQSGFGFRWLIRHQSTSWDRNRHRHRRNNSNHCTRDDGDVTVKKIKKTKTIKKSINNNNNKSIKNNNNNSNSNRTINKHLKQQNDNLIISSSSTMTRKNDEKQQQRQQINNHHSTILANNDNYNDKNDKNIDKFCTKNPSEFKIIMNKSIDFANNNDHHHTTMAIDDQRKLNNFSQNRIVGFLTTKTSSWRNRIHDYFNEKMNKFLIISGDDDNHNVDNVGNQIRKPKPNNIEKSLNTSFISSLSSSTIEEGFTPEDCNDSLSDSTTLSQKTKTKSWTSFSLEQTTSNVTDDETESNHMMMMMSDSNDQNDQQAKQDSLILIRKKQKQQKPMDDHHVGGVKSVKITETSLPFLSTAKDYDDDHHHETFHQAKSLLSSLSFTLLSSTSVKMNQSLLSSSSSSLHYSLPMKDDERADKMEQIKRLLNAELASTQTTPTTTTPLGDFSDDNLDGDKIDRKKLDHQNHPQQQQQQQQHQQISSTI